MEFELLEGSVVALEVAEIVPTHGVDVGLTDFFRKLGVVGGHKEEELLIADKTLLLDDVGICTGDPNSFDFRHEEIADSLNGLCLVRY